MIRLPGVLFGPKSAVSFSSNTSYNYITNVETTSFPGSYLFLSRGPLEGGRESKREDPGNEVDVEKEVVVVHRGKYYRLSHDVIT